MHNRRGGHRPQNRFRQNFDQQGQASNNPDGQASTTTTTNYSNNRGFNKYFRPTMLEDPWANMTPQKVPPHGTSLIFEASN
jgi:hypothetical protein